MKKTVNVVGAIIEKDGLVFCTQRGDSKSLAFKWEFPGGKIESNETEEEALIREIKEELDSTIQVISFFKKVYFEYESFNIYLSVYRCKLEKGQLLLSEHVDSAWADKKLLSILDFAEADKPIVSDLLEVDWIIK